MTEGADLVVGRVGRPHGIRGEVSVAVSTDDPVRRYAVGTVLRTDPPERGPLTVESARWHAGRLLARFADVTDRETAESLRGTLLVVAASSSLPLDDPDEFWDHELAGLRAETGTGEVLGEVVDLLHLPAQDVLVVARPEGGEVLVPFVRAFVPVVDVAGGRVVVEPPPGLLDEE